MGVGIGYRSKGPVTAATWEQMQLDVEAAVSARDSWSESIWLKYDPTHEPHLLGFTKLFLYGYSTDDGGYEEVDPDEDSLMAWSDGNYVATKLCEWSAKYGVDWEIDLEGPIGSIESGRPDYELAEYFRTFSTMTDLPSEDSFRIRGKYSKRNDAEYVAREQAEPPTIHEVFPPETCVRTGSRGVEALGKPQVKKPWWKVW